ncbi:MAG TPA: SMP-30/gluconolactonase/LRE family protein [Steroidobacteraceae bacterium]|nr:SMP-30/gluconolactonase/LRE family protein [Steroidobacteraceae bacterium]
MKHCLLTLVAAASVASFAQAQGIKVLNADAHFPEGPIWYHGKLYYVEYDRNSVTTWDGDAKNTLFWSKKGCGPSAVIPTARGEFLVTCYDSGSIGRISSDGKDLPAYTHDQDGNPFVGPNDFAPDRHGGIYFTCSGTPAAMIDGKIFYLAADGTITQKAAEVHSANGIVVSNDGKTLYAIETEDHRLIEFKIGADGSLSDRRVFLNLDDLTGNVTLIYPDGVKIDSKGEIYIGQNPRDVHAPLAGSIFVVNAHGKLLRTLKLPSPGVPNFAFSPDQRTLYVMALDQLDKPPYAGKVYSIPIR